jgi:hypothetical protein
LSNIDENRSFGSVFKAIHVPTQQCYAVKSIKIRKQKKEAILKEIDLLRQIQDGNIVQYHGNLDLLMIRLFFSQRIYMDIIGLLCCWIHC